jgi:hypothetical protein
MILILFLLFIMTLINLFLLFLINFILILKCLILNIILICYLKIRNSIGKNILLIMSIYDLRLKFFIYNLLLFEMR